MITSDSHELYRGLGELKIYRNIHNDLWFDDESPLASFADL